VCLNEYMRTLVRARKVESIKKDNEQNCKRCTGVLRRIRTILTSVNKWQRIVIFSASFTNFQAGCTNLKRCEYIWYIYTHANCFKRDLFLIYSFSLRFINTFTNTLPEIISILSPFNRKCNCCNSLSCNCP